MIKNKTLHFLAKSLPYLKDDMDSIPKVVKISKQDAKPAAAGPLPVEIANGYYDYSHVHKRKKRSVVGKDHKQARGLFSGVNNASLSLAALARQKACEQKDGM